MSSDGHFDFATPLTLPHFRRPDSDSRSPRTTCAQSGDAFYPWAEMSLYDDLVARDAEQRLKVRLQAQEVLP